MSNTAETKIVTLEDGRRAFTKRAISERTAGWLRREARVYRALRDRDFVPECIDFVDGERPVLILEDLSESSIWPPPWSAPQIAEITRILDALADVEPPSFVPRVDMDIYRGWQRVADDPEPFLGLGLCSRAWLERAISRLLAAERACCDEPWVLTHGDVRSDNLCFRAGAGLLVDWNWIACAPRQLDRAFWSVSLVHEAEVEPEQLVSVGVFWPARVSGFFAARAGQPDPPGVPGLRASQARMLKAALAWAVRQLTLPDPDGPAFRASTGRVPPVSGSSRR